MVANNAPIEKRMNMGRQKEIDKVATELMRIAPITDKQAYGVAEYLVDNGIGTKDRFEMGVGYGSLHHLEQFNKIKKTLVIKPREYEK